MVRRAAWALTAVHALDVETADDILADMELALALRRGPEPPAPYRLSPGALRWLSRLTAPHQRSWRYSWPPTGASSQPPGPATGPGAPDRYVPIGLTIGFRDEQVSGELDLMSYARTPSGGRLTGSWRTRDALGRWRPWRHHVPPMDLFTVTDDRGVPYELGFNVRVRPGSAGNLRLRPDPPADIRWLDVTARGQQPVRVSLESRRQGPAEGAGLEVTETAVSAGEQLLNKLAQQLLATASHFPRDLRLRLPARSPGPLTDLAAGSGAVVAALEAAGALSPLSPVPGRLAALCAGLRVGGHRITAAPAPDLPEPWLSVLSHYWRRKPDPAPVQDGFAAVATALPELAGIKLALLGLHHSDGQTWLNALARGPVPDRRHAMLGLDMSFPLSVWIRDSAGRWHAACPAAGYDDDGERTLTLRLIPPLTRPASWIEVLVAGPSAEVRAGLPLRWQ